MSEVQKIGVTDFVSKRERMENYPDFERLTHVIRSSLQEFIV